LEVKQNIANLKKRGEHKTVYCGLMFASFNFNLWES